MGGGAHCQAKHNVAKEKSIVLVLKSSYGMSLLSHNAYDLCHIQWTIV